MFPLRAVAFGFVAIVLAALEPTNAQNASYQLVQSSVGSNFFDNWIFYDGLDINNTGAVVFQSKDQATQNKLIFNTDSGTTVIKVDNTTDGRGNSSFGRGSIKVLSQYTFTTGNLLLFDALHMPYGCSVWPALWTQGPAWPDNGEIDIVEGVNQQQTNRISLHTLDGCNHPTADLSSSLESGNLISTDCFNRTNFNQGCIVEVEGPSYGEAFAQNGGGVYALLWDTTGISVWFFPRPSIPADLPTDSPNPAGWGLPTAFYPQTSCDFSTFFTPQTLIIDTTICGNFAGQPNVFAQTCSGTCLDLVQVPENYDNAYFEISYIKLFEQCNGACKSASTTAVGTVTVTSTDLQSGTSPTASQPGSSSGAMMGAYVPVISLTAIIILQILGGRL